MRYLLFLLAFVIISSSQISISSTVERPPKEYPNLAKRDYNYIWQNKKALFGFSLNNTAKLFISKNEIYRYLKLKFRNFIKSYEFIDSNEQFYKDIHNWMTIDLDLSKYNDKLNIYFGLISFKLKSLYDPPFTRPKLYELTFAIAGSQEQIRTVIKGYIDLIVEVFAEDYYMIGDLNKKNN